MSGVVRALCHVPSPSALSVKANYSFISFIELGWTAEGEGGAELFDHTAEQPLHRFEWDKVLCTLGSMEDSTRVLNFLRNFFSFF